MKRGCFLLSTLRSVRPLVGRFNTELLSVLNVQALPTFELHPVAAHHAADGSSVEKAIQNIQADVPARRAPRDEAAIDVVPQRQARAAPKGFQFPSDIAVLKQFGSVGSTPRFCERSGGRSHPGEIHRVPNRTQAPIDYEGSPLAEMRRIGKRLPDFFRRVAQFPGENERPLFSVLSHLRPAGWPRSVSLVIRYLSSPFTEWPPLIVCELGELNEVAASVLQHR